MKKNLVLLGMMGVGKTTLGKIVARRQKREFIDTDKLVEKKLSMKIPEIFIRKGEKFFRSEEAKEVLKSLKKTNCVIAIGGGAFINKTVREKILKNSISIWLDCNLEVLNKRVKWNKNRPLINMKNTKKKMEELYNERKNIYRLADHKINCGALTKESIYKKIMNIYENR